MTDNVNIALAESVAIIGMAGRFPGASNIESLWKNIVDGVESITFYSEEELIKSGASAELIKDHFYVRAASVISEPDHFDAEFFGFSPIEAELTDPQQRVFLECAFEALERSGYDPDDYPGAIGVFAGSGVNTYQFSLKRAYEQEISTSTALQVAFVLGNDKDYLTTRTSYKLNLRGPSVCVQTACSTSLVAVHAACQSVLSGESDLALAGGVSVMNFRKEGYYYSEGGMYSPDGRCRPFDVDSNGTIFGDGVGIVVLKRADQAIKDGDRIHALIRGSAVNNDGGRKLGYSAPSVDGQAHAITEALAVAGIRPEQLGYIEAHGTATQLGDPVEIAALTKVFRTSTDQRQFCPIGSVKGNVGHLSAAAGVTGLIKAALAVEHGILPPSINFTEANPKIEMDSSPFYVGVRSSPWLAKNGPRRAGINSFGIGGTNAHVVLEEPPPINKADESPRSHHLLVLSARTASALDIMRGNLLDHLRQHPEDDIADVAFTLATGRRRFRHRLAVCCDGISHAVSALKATAATSVTNEITSEPLSCAFLFPGQGTQHIGMGAALYRVEPEYRQAFDQCAEGLKRTLNLDLRDLLFGRATEDLAARLSETWLAQPAIFCVSYALARLWMAWNVKPQSMIGHSVGELVAACIAEVFDLEQGLQIIAARGRLMQDMPRGAMLAVAAEEAFVCSLMNGSVSIAALNGPTACVVSGTIDGIEALEAQLRERGVIYSRLRTSHAFHSPMMDQAAHQFTELLSSMSLRKPKIPFISNVTGTWITEAEARDPAYWGRQLRESVRFADGLKAISSSQPQILLEVGPGRILSGLVTHEGFGAKCLVVSSLPSADDTRNQEEHFLRTVGQVWMAGAPVDLSAMYKGQKRRRALLPTYPFERKRYWFDESKIGIAAAESVQAPRTAEHMLYAVSWKRVLKRLPTLTPDELAQKSILFFSGDDGLSRMLGERLRSRCRRVVTVKSGPALAEEETDRFTVSPGTSGDFHVLMRRLDETECEIDIVIYAWSLFAGASIPQSEHDAIDRAFFGVLHLFQALNRRERLQQVEVAVLTADTADVIGGESVSPLAALAKGTCLAGTVEYRDITCRYIDFASGEIAGTDVPALADSLIEHLVGPPSSAVMAYRRLQIWSPHYEPMQVGPTPEDLMPLRPGGVYIITGGLGDLGLAVGVALSTKVHARIVLVSRKQLPGRDAWEAEKKGKTASIIGQIRQMEANGAEVLVQSADVADSAAMQAIINKTLARFGTVNGVIHAAGLLGKSSIDFTNRQAAAQVLAPKVHGTLVLSQVLAPFDLDFVILFSSISALTGYLGQADYSAANAFLDAVAHSSLFGAATKVISVNWDAWSELGMAIQWDGPQEMRDIFAAELKAGIRTKEGMELFFHILSECPRQVLVTKGDLNRLGVTGRLQSKVQANTAPPDASQPMQLNIERRHGRPILEYEFVAPSSELEKIISEIWATFLNIDRIGIKDNFFDLGGNSLMALQILPRLRGRFQLDLTPHEVFLAPTIEKLAQLIEAKLISEIETVEGAIAES